MSKALVLGAAALVFSAASASAQVYPTPDYGYAEPVADLAVPADGYAAPAPPPAYAAPPVYAAPVYTAPQVYVVPAPVYAALVVPAPVYTAPAVSRPIYAYDQGIGVVTGMCGTGTVTGGGAKHVGEWRAGAEATTVGSAVAVRLLHRDDARRQKAAAQDIVSKRRGSIRALAQDQEPGSASGETRGGPTHGDKEFKQKRLAL